VGAGFSAHEQNTRRVQAQKIVEGIMYQSCPSGWKGIFSRHAILRHNDEFWKYRTNLAAAGIVRLILRCTIILTNFVLSCTFHGEENTMKGNNYIQHNNVNI
jgi:uncharacterized protein YjeT (DUF2065 family)